MSNESVVIQEISDSAANSFAEIIASTQVFSKLTVDTCDTLTPRSNPALFYIPLFDCGRHCRISEFLMHPAHCIRGSTSYYQLLFLLDFQIKDMEYWIASYDKMVTYKTELELLKEIVIEYKNGKR